MGLERAGFTSTHLKNLNLKEMRIADVGMGWVAQVWSYIILPAHEGG